MAETRRHDTVKNERLAWVGTRSGRASGSTNAPPGVAESIGKHTGARRPWILGIALLLSASGAACAPSTPTTLCERIAAGGADIIDALFGYVEEELTPEEIDALTLQAVPGELQTVLDYQEFFITREHPLVDALPGTEIEPLESLDGCWGRVELESLGDDDSFEWVVAEAWRVDLSANTLDEYIMKGVDGTPCLSDQRPIVQSFHNTIQQTDDMRVTVRTESGLAAGLDNDDSLSFHELGIVGIAVSIDQERFFRFSVEGDYLITSEEQYDPQQPLRADMDFWVRFECPE